VTSLGNQQYALTQGGPIVLAHCPLYAAQPNYMSRDGLNWREQHARVPSDDIRFRYLAASNLKQWVGSSPSDNKVYIGSWSEVAHNVA
jgi:hypothetical protein